MVQYVGILFLISKGRERHLHGMKRIFMKHVQFVNKEKRKCLK